jgi:hypothetical protein
MRLGPCVEQLAGPAVGDGAERDQHEHAARGPRGARGRRSAASRDDDARRREPARHRRNARPPRRDQRSRRRPRCRRLRHRRSARQDRPGPGPRLRTRRRARPVPRPRQKRLLPRASRRAARRPHQQAHIICRHAGRDQRLHGRVSRGGALVRPTECVYGPRVLQRRAGVTRVVSPTARTRGCGRGRGSRPPRRPARRWRWTAGSRWSSHVRRRRGDDAR